MYPLFWRHSVEPDQCRGQEYLCDVSTPAIEVSHRRESYTLHSDDVNGSDSVFYWL